MGACCSNPNNQNVDAPGNMKPVEQHKGTKSELTLHGDYFASEVRTIIAGLDYCGVAYTFKEVNTFIGQHKEEPYLQINPIGQIPTIVDGNTTVIGGYSTFLTYLASARPSLGKTLYPPKC